MKVSRNDPCPCGSGEKYKRCCNADGTTPSSSWSQGFMVLVVIFILAGAVGLGAAFYKATQAEAPEQVWNEEHGHFHNDGGTPTLSEPAPQPGPAPPGKVWSPEHGHWHDAAGPASPTSGPAPQPPGPVPEGKVWNEEHGHWHDAPPAN